MPSAVILTALGVELGAVLGHLSGIREEMHQQGTIYHCGQFLDEDRVWEVAVAQVGVGNSTAALETERALSHFGPDIALFVGVAGGLKDVDLGDVVAAPQVFLHESGKADATFQPRPATALSSYRMEQRANAVTANGRWQTRISDLGHSRVPIAVVAPIVAGEKVVASEQSASYQLIRSIYGAAAAVEMEGYGFLVAARGNPNVDALVVRGISDLIEGKTDADASGSQRIASKHAAAFAFEVLTTFRLPNEITNETLNATTRSLRQVGVYRADEMLETLDEHRTPFQMDDDRAARIKDVREALATTERPWHLRIIGQQHIGKTRSVLEALRGAGPSAVYAVDPNRVGAWTIWQLVDGFEQAILVVDDCPAEQAEDLYRDIQMTRGRVCLITIGSEELVGGTTLNSLLQAPSDETTRRIVLATAGTLSPEIAALVAQRCGGNLQLARQLAIKAAKQHLGADEVAALIAESRRALVA